MKNDYASTAVELADMFDIFQRDYMLTEEHIETDALRYATNRIAFMMTFLKVKNFVGHEVGRRGLDPRQRHADDLPRPLGELRDMWRKTLEIFIATSELTPDDVVHDLELGKMWLSKPKRERMS